MYQIDDNNNIELIRGDTLYAKVDVLCNGRPYIPEEGDVIRFAMKRRYKDGDEKVLIDKIIPNDSLMLKLDPEDTKELKMNKIYVYDIQLTKANGDIDTFVSAKVKLKEEVF